MWGMAISFDEARAMVAATQGWDPARWGWENDEVFVMAYDYGDEPIPAGEPDLIVDKLTGESRWVADRSLLPSLRPIGTPPD